MLSVNNYPQGYIDDRSRAVRAQVASYRAVLDAAKGRSAEAAIATFERQFFDNMLLALDAMFMHRSRTMEPKDGNPLNEVRVLCTSILQNGGVVVADKTSGPIDSSVPDVIAGHIVSIVREALSNVARHARASKVDVVVVVDNWRVLVEVTDDGAGLPAELVGGGHGLENMLRRAAAVGGSLAILDCITGGTRLTWEAPLISASAA